MKTSKNKYKKSDQLNLKAIITLNRCVQSVQKQERPVIQSTGLTVPQFGVLECLYHKGSLRVVDILNKTLSTGGNMTVVIDNLEKRGLIQRLTDPDDRRAILIQLTEKGEKSIEELFPRHVENLRKVFGILSDEEKKQLILLTKKLGKSFSAK
jgi:MarR family transcriptional regulator, 2-MHQ and catechol-resistance regulon repressor